MRKNKALFALLTGVLAAALFALPASAMADEAATVITQDDLTDGVYTITDPGKYELGGDINGRIEFKPNKIEEEYSLDLDGHTLTNTSDGNALYCYSWVRDVEITVSNGNVVKTGANTQAIRADGKAKVNLNDVNVEATDGICVYAESLQTAVYINGGSYKTTNKTANEAVLCTAYAEINVAGAPVFTLDGGSNIVQVNYGDGSVSLSGGTFSAFPDAAELSDATAYSFHKTSKGFEVISGTDLPEDACWVVKLDDNSVIFFDTTADEEEFVTAYGDRVTSAEQKRATVTFDPANGDDAVTRLVTIGETATGQVENPIKNDGIFKCWSEDGKTDFNIEATKITKDTKLTALYDAAVATDGHEGYSSLQSAIDAVDPAAAATVTLLQDTTEYVAVYDGVNLTIDLNGKTLKGVDYYATIDLFGAVDLTITNSADTGATIESATAAAIYADESAAGSTVTLKGDITVKTTSDDEHDAAVYVSGASTLIIEEGVYSAMNGGAHALYAENGATVSVKDASFESASASTIWVAGPKTKADFACDISGHIELINDAVDENVVIHAGTLGDATNAVNVESGKYLYKGEEEDSYKVITLEDEEYVYDANFVVYNEEGTTKVYFKTYKAAEAYADSIEGTIINLYRATLVANGEEVEIRVREVNDELGELPGSDEYQVEDYTFAGWYVDGVKVDSSYKVQKNVNVVAMWYWNGSSDDEPTTNPTEKGKHLPQTGDPAVAISGIAAAGAALAGFGLSLIHI